MSKSFVHLHVHSEYSLLESSVKTKTLAKTAAAMGMPAVALTDNGNMFGAAEFYFACKDNGVKPLIGCDFYLAPGSRHDKTQDKNAVRVPDRRIVLLAQNIEGYRNLCRLSSIGYKEGFYYKPRIDFEVLKEHSANVIALTGGIRGEVPWNFTERGADEALLKLRELKSIFDDRLYLELNRTGLPQWNQINQFLLEAAQIEKLPYVAANDVHYLTRDDQMAQEVLICIGTNKTLQDEGRFRLGTDQFYFKSSDEMRALFKDLPEACDQSLEIADRCNVEFKIKDDSGKPIYHLPSYPTKGGVSLTEEIARVAKEGLLERFKEAEARGETVSEEDKPKYYERLEYELRVIDGMGFNGYFLIVQDFINWAKENGVPVGPGRGSGAGSLVAYALKITDLDPMPHKLIFERFLNPERISMPDFDIDFCQERRHEVINYVTQKYGAASVSQIITYGKLQARAAIRDVGRVLGMTYSEVDTVSKLMPDKLGITLSEAIDMEPRIKESMDMNPQVQTMMELAQRVEGLVRHAGIHAAGVIIADGQLVDHAPLYRGTDDENVVQYDMKHAEKIGLIKFDFLGLKTLTHIQYALELIKSNRKTEIQLTEISLSDPGIYEIMSEGDTAGIFQFEGEGITDTIKKVKPTNFADITAINALYRPGPMAMIPDFAARKHGQQKVEYIFEELEEILQETYGIIVYQEQVQLIAAKIANYSLGEADMLRRAMGKKIPEEMAKQRERFLKGARENNHDIKKAEELFDLMDRFAAYGFNKSHAAAYCVIAAQTAWLKRYYPVEFYAALLSTEMSDTDKVVKYVKDAQKHGIEVHPPNVNFSDYKFTVNGDSIYFSLGAIKGVGQGAVEAIVEARRNTENGRFSSLEDFFVSIDLRKVNKKTIECLIKAGALDDFGYHRAQLLNGYQQFLDRAEVKRKEAEVGQINLFDQSPALEEKVEVAEVKPWARPVELSNEKEVLGFFLSDHPLRGYDEICKVWTTCSVKELPEVAVKAKEAEAGLQNVDPQPKRGRMRDRGKKRVILAGLLTTLREIITKKGTRMAFAQLEDLTGSVELVIFPDTYAHYEVTCKDERPLLVAGLLEYEDGVCKIMVDSVKLLEDVLGTTKGVIFHLDKIQEPDFPRLHQLISEYSGKAKVSLCLKLQDLNKQIKMDLGAEGINPSSEFFEAVHSAFGTTDFIEISH